MLKNLDPDRSNKTSRRILIASVALYWVALYIYVPILPVYVQERVPSLALVGTILSMYGLLQAVIRLPLGIVSDRIGRYKPFLLIGFLCAFFGAWMLIKGVNFTALLFGRAVTGLAASAWVLLVVSFSGLFPPEEAIRATSLLTIVNSLSRLVATASTGFLVQTGGFHLPFGVAMGISAAGCFLVLASREMHRGGSTPLNWAELKQLVGRPDVLRPSIMGAVGQYVAWAATLSFTPLLADRLGADSITQSFLASGTIGVVSLGNMLTAWLANRMGSRRLATASFVFLALGALGAATAPSLPWLFVAQWILGLGSGISHPLLMGMSIARVPSGQRATAMGLHQAVYGFGMFAGPWASGLLADEIGINGMFLVTGIMALIIGVAGARWATRPTL